MLVKDIRKAKEFTAADKCLIKEMLSPLRDRVKTRHSLAYARVLPGKSTIPHSLGCCEIYFITRGKGIMRIGKETHSVRQGCIVCIPPNAVQSIKNTGKSALEFLCIVDPPWQAGKEKILA
jgi:mannose-6-phosphate isomerase-like protein (cupin superfamily)